MRAVAVLGLTALVGLCGAPLAAEQAGVSAAVVGQIQLAALDAGPGAVGRMLKSGEQIFIGDRIRSGGESGMQIMLLDETVFTIGANSELTVDEFVYDPVGGTGKLSASISRGAFRFVTGKIAQGRPESMTVRTPISTIGVRGTIVDGLIEATREIFRLGGPGTANTGGQRIGAVDIFTGSGTAALTRPGFGVIVQPGLPPTALRLDAETNRRLDGGVRTAPRPTAPGTGGEQQAARVAPVPYAEVMQTALLLRGSAAPGERFAAADTVRQSAAQDNSVPAVLTSTFDDLRTQTGSATYNSSGHALTGVSGGGGSGTYSVVMTVDFSARSIFAVFFYDVTSGPNAVNNSVGGSSSFSTGSGAFSASGSNNCGISGFVCTGTYSFRNGGSTVAATSSHSMSVSGGGAVSTGTGTGNRTNQ